MLEYLYKSPVGTFNQIFGCPINLLKFDVFLNILDISKKKKARKSLILRTFTDF